MAGKAYIKKLINLMSKRTFIDNSAADIFREFRKICKYIIKSSDYSPCCNNPDNSTLIEVLGGGYFECSVESCPLLKGN